MSQENQKAEVQPETELCFWCGKAKDGQPVKEGSKQMVSDYNTCPACAEQMGRGVKIIEVQLDEPLSSNQPAILTIAGGHQMYPTGRWAIISEDVALIAFKNGQKVVEEGVAFLSPEAWKKMNFKHDDDVRVGAHEQEEEQQE